MPAWSARSAARRCAIPTASPARCARSEGGAIALEASHDGYVERFGLIHSRTLTLDAAGTRLDGCDRLTAAKGVVRFCLGRALRHPFPRRRRRRGAHRRIARRPPSCSSAAASIGASPRRARPPRSRRAVLRRHRRRAPVAPGGAARPVPRRDRGHLDPRADPRRPPPLARKRNRAIKRLSARLADTAAGFA